MCYKRFGNINKSNSLHAHFFRHISIQLNRSFYLNMGMMLSVNEQKKIEEKAQREKDVWDENKTKMRKETRIEAFDYIDMSWKGTSEASFHQYDSNLCKRLNLLKYTIIWWLHLFTFILLVMSSIRRSVFFFVCDRKSFSPFLVVADSVVRFW